MDDYSAKTERQMKRLYHSLGERDRRRYAAVEVDKLGHGGLEIFPNFWGAIQRRFDEGLLSWNQKKNSIQIINEKKGGTKIVEGIKSTFG